MGATHTTTIVIDDSGHTYATCSCSWHGDYHYGDRAGTLRLAQLDAAAHIEG